MTILLAPDKFRGSLTAAEACQAMAEGLHLADPTVRTIEIPLADGGEGTLDVLLAASGGRKITTPTQDPLGRPIEATFGLSGDGRTAYVELASASGLHWLAENERNALAASTFGTGQLLRAALNAGATHLLLGLGGSATTDGGTGLAAALGVRFWDESGGEIQPSGGTLAQIHRIDASGSLFDPEKTTLTVACDVAAPLFGPDGAAQVYAPQKGANPAQVAQLDAGLRHLSLFFAPQLAYQPGAGAAGGAGFGALAFLNARLRPGTDLVFEQTGFDAYLAQADLVITGEGKLDAQTLQGKLIGGVCGRAAAQNVPVAALCGTLDADPLALANLGLCYAASVLTRPGSLDAALASAYPALREAAFWLLRGWQTAQIARR